MNLITVITLALKPVYGHQLQVEGQRAWCQMLTLLTFGELCGFVSASGVSEGASK